MAGGTWASQNKVRPGVYIRFASGPGAGAHGQRPGRGSHRGGHELGPGGDGAGDRGRGQYDPLTPGMTSPIPKNRFLNEIFKGTNRTAAPNKLLLYRLGPPGRSRQAQRFRP